MGLTEALKEYWYLFLVLLALILVLVWAVKKAAAAVVKHNTVVTREREYLERFTELNKKYSGLTKEAARSAPAAELIEGVTAVLQRRIEKSPDRLAEFNAAPEWQRMTYAAYYFTQDAGEALSGFFKNNGKPTDALLTELAGRVCPDSLARIVREMYSMYDGDNDRVSFDKKRVEELDANFREQYDKDEFCERVKEFIVSSFDR